MDVQLTNMQTLCDAIVPVWNKIHDFSTKYGPICTFYTLMNIIGHEKRVQFQYWQAVMKWLVSICTYFYIHFHICIILCFDNFF